jgi:hypothetical protein
MFINSAGNLVALEEALWEIDGSGNVINKGKTYTRFLHDIIETKSGYLAAGFKTDDTNLTIIHFDTSF